MRRVVLIEPERFVLEDVPIPKPGPADVIVEVERSGICGSDVHIYHGVSSIKPPLVLGHEFSGRVHVTGRQVEGFARGDRALAEPGVPCGNCTYCDSGHYNLCPRQYTIGGWPDHDGAYADYVRVPAANLLRLPASMTFEDGAMVEPVACAMHALELADIEPGATVLVIGAGPIGNLLAQAAKLAGAGRVVVADLVAERLALAKAVGADDTVNAAETDLVAWAEDACGEGGVHCIFDAASTPTTFRQAVEIVRRGGRIITVGVPTRAVEWHPVALLREFQLTGMNMYVRHNFEDAIEAMLGGKIDISQLVTATYPLAEVDRAYDRVMHDPARCKIMLAPQLG